MREVGLLGKWPLQGVFGKSIGSGLDAACSNPREAFADQPAKANDCRGRDSSPSDEDDPRRNDACRQRDAETEPRQEKSQPRGGT